MENIPQIYAEFLTNKSKMLGAIDEVLKNLPSKEAMENSLGENAEAARERIGATHDFLDTVIRVSMSRSIDIVFSKAESEIEKIFLNSLILRSFMKGGCPLVFTDHLSDPITYIEALRTKYLLLEELLQDVKRTFTGDEKDNLVQIILSSNDTEENKLREIAFLMEYFGLDFYNKFHISIQTTFPNIRVEGKCIKPDIFIWLPSKPEFKLIVECDGYAYHSDKTSFTKDRIRDRKLQEQGFQVLRFSGQEIVADPLYKSEELDNYLAKLSKTPIATSLTQEEWFEKGNVSYNLKRYEEAVQAYEQVIYHNPKMVKAYYNKGVALAKLKRYEEAIRTYEQAIRLNPKFVRAYCDEGIALHQLKRYEEAILAYEEAIRLDPKYTDAYMNKSAALSELKRYEEAVQFCEEAIRLDSNNAKFYTNKGLMLYELERYEEAIQAYTRAICLEPDNEKARLNKGLALAALNLYEEAIEEFEQIIQFNSKGDIAYVFVCKGIALTKLNHYEEAILVYEEAIHLYPSNAVLYRNKAGVLSTLKRYEEAVQACEQSLCLDPNDASTYAAKCLALNELKRYSEAKEAHRKVYELKGNESKKTGN